MSDPIILRSEAITKVVSKLEGKLDDSISGSQANEQLQSLSSDVSSNQTSLSVISNDIVQMKEAIALMQKQIGEIASNVNVALTDVTIADADAPTDEDKVSDSNPTPITYRVDTGSINSTAFKVDSTSICKHYTYDTFHLVTINTSYTGGDANGTDVTLATFPSLASYSGNGYVNGYLSLDGYSVYPVVVDGSNLKVQVPSGYQLTPNTSPLFYQAFWFDRSTTSRMFDVQEGQLISSTVAINTPSYAMHASIGNLHFLCINTKTVSIINRDTLTAICQFNDNLSITTGGCMGFGYADGSNGVDTFYVMAPNNNTISINFQSTPAQRKKNLMTIPANTFITISLFWIDGKATANDCDMVGGRTPALNTADSFAKYFVYKHLNALQIYGNATDRYLSKYIARFDNVVLTPAYNTNYIRAGTPIAKSGGVDNDSYNRVVYTFQRDSGNEFTDLMVKSGADSTLDYFRGYVNATILWMA